MLYTLQGFLYFECQAAGNCQLVAYASTDSHHKQISATRHSGWDALREVENILRIPLQLVCDERVEIRPIVSTERHILVNVVLVRLAVGVRLHRIVKSVNVVSRCHSVVGIVPVSHHLNAVQGGAVHKGGGRG